MKEFEYIINDELGLHARPAGLLAKKAMQFQSVITIQKNDKSADCKRIFAVMGLSVKHNDTIIIKIEGDDEEQAEVELIKYIQDNL